MSVCSKISPVPSTSESCRSPAALSLLLVVVLLAFCLRTYRLDEQAAWTDDHGSVRNLAAPDLPSYLALKHIVSPEHSLSPLYYTIQFFYGKVFGADLAVLRLLPVMFSVLCVSALYRLGAYLYGPCAGLIAALCLALSPPHIWYGQELRQNSLLFLLCIISVHTFSRAWRERNPRALILNLLVNALLPWTHVLSVLLLVAEGGFLVLRLPRSFRHMLLWVGLQWLLLVPWLALFLLRRPYFINEFSSRGIRWSEIFAQVFLQDIISRHNDLLPPWKTVPAEALPINVLYGLSFQVWGDLALTSLLVMCSLVVLANVVFQFGRSLRGEVRPEPRDACDAGTMLLLVLVVPGFTLGVLEMATGYILLAPMYSMYSLLALYVMVGRALSLLPLAPLRITAAIALLGLYGYQLVLLLPQTTRADWHACARHIIKHGAPSDAIIELKVTLGPGRELEYHLRRPDLAYRQVKTFQAASDDAAAFLYAHPDRVAWIAFDTFPLLWSYQWPGIRSIKEGIAASYFESQDILAANLEARNLRYAVTRFPGHYNVILFRVETRPGQEPDLTHPVLRGFEDFDPERVLDELGVHFETSARHEEAVYALRREVEGGQVSFAVVEVWHALGMLEQGQIEIAEALCRRTLRRAPRFAMCQFVLGLVLLARGQDDAAQAAFREAFAEDASLASLFADYVSAFHPSPNCESIRSELARFQSLQLLFLTPGVRAAADARCPCSL